MRTEEWRIPPEFQPDPETLAYDLDGALQAVVGLRSRVPDNAYTAGTLGTERAGQGIVIRPDGLVLTIGYLIAEADEVWLTMGDGRTVQGHALAYDYESGFGLVQALGALGVPHLPIGDSRNAGIGARVVIAGAGGRAHALRGTIVGRQEFAGYWEYAIDEAIFTAPAHPFWGGTALIGPRGDLLGVGSLQLQHQTGEGPVLPINMMVPIDLLKPILDDLLTRGRVDRAPRPWLGVYAGEDETGRVVVLGLAGDGPARKAGLAAGDAVLAVGNTPVESLAGFWRALWALGDAGVDVPLTLMREDDSFDVTIRSASRDRYLKIPGRLH